MGKKKDKFNPKDELAHYNKPRLITYNQSADSIWFDNLGKYELTSIKNGMIMNTIRPAKKIFIRYKTIDKDTGEKITALDGRSIKLICVDDYLCHFFHKKEAAFLDVFKLHPLSHVDRIKLKNKYRFISNSARNIFYGINSNEDGDPILYKIEIMSNKTNPLSYSSNNGIAHSSVPKSE